MLDPDDPALVLVAVETSRILLHSAAGQEAFAAKNCPMDVRAFLRPFRDAKVGSGDVAYYYPDPEQQRLLFGCSPSEPSSSSTMRRVPSVEAWFWSSRALSEDAFCSPQLWTPGEAGGYNRWICNLTARLLADCYCHNHPTAVVTSDGRTVGSASQSQSQQYDAADGDGSEVAVVQPVGMRQLGLSGHDTFLRHCLPMCRARSDFAELIFPAIVDDLTRCAPPRARAVMSACFGRHLLDTGRSDGDHLRAMRLALVTINAMREQRWLHSRCAPTRQAWRP